MHYLLYSLIVIAVMAAAIAHFILLVLKVDHNASYSYWTTIVPALIVYSAGAIVFIVYSLKWFVTSRNYIKSYGFLALFVLVVGSIWTQIQLANKFDLNSNITYLSAFLPFIISLLLAGILFLIGIIKSSIKIAY